MPSIPPSAPASAPPSDTALVERAGRGDRQALAILYARHAPGVHARAIQAGRSPVEAARVLRDVFRAARRSLGSSSAAHEPRAWLRSLTMDRLAGSAGPGSRLDPATARAAAAAGPTLTPAVRDAVWRELERAWHDEALPLWRRQPGTLAATGLVGLLVAAVAVVGLLLREQIRPVAPARAVALTAEPMELPVAQPEQPPPPAPSVIVPPVQTDEPFVAPEEPEDPSPSPVAPSPTPEPSPTETSTESPSPEPTDEPTEDDTDGPLLPLPGSGSDEPSPSPTEGSGDTGGGTSDGSGGDTDPAPPPSEGTTGSTGDGGNGA